MLLSLAGEVVVLRERLDTAERLIDESGDLKVRMDAYRPSAPVIAEREAWRACFLDIVMRPVQQDYEALEEEPALNGYESALEIVSRSD